MTNQGCFNMTKSRGASVADAAAAALSSALSGGGVIYCVVNSYNKVIFRAYAIPFADWRTPHFFQMTFNNNIN